MEFDKAKVFTAVNASEVKIGSKGYFSDSFGHLKELVSNNSLTHYGELTAIHPDYRYSRFEMDNTSNWLLFYLVEEPGVNKMIKDSRSLSKDVEDKAIKYAEKYACKDCRMKCEHIDLLCGCVRHYINAFQDGYKEAKRLQND